MKPKRPGSGEGEAPAKACRSCESILATAVRVCPDCGHAFPPPKLQVEREATTLAILTSGEPQWTVVDGVGYRAYETPGKRRWPRVARPGGAYLEAIARSDLATLSPTE